MNYLKLSRSRIILGSFLVFALLAATFPSIDLQISRLFHNGHSFGPMQGWQKALQGVLPYYLCLSVGAVVALYLYNRFNKRNVCRVNGRRVVFLLLVGIIGAGLIVNVAFKNNVGRARPRDVAEFGGQMAFTPAFVLSDQCKRNCSFSSGDAAAAFYSLAVVMVLTRRRRYFVAGLAFGAAVSYARIAAGAHFFSDTVTSFFVMLITADVLFYYLVMTPADRLEAQRQGLRLRPALAAEATGEASGETPGKLVAASSRAPTAG